MEQSAANNLSEECRIQLRRAGLRLLAWPLLTVGGMIYYWIAPKGEFRLHIDPTFLVFGFLAFRFMTGDRRYATLALIGCWVLLFAGTVFIATGLLFPVTNVKVSAFIVLFGLSGQNALVAVCLNLLLFGWPIIPLARARKAMRQPDDSTGCPA